MGVRGLTTYIAKNAEKYLNPYELHDCNLVIDGDSLASNLYRWVSNCNSAFGGNYDQYFRSVCNFFAMLKQCNVTPYVLLDGGYQRRKLRTVQSRLRSKISTIKHLNPFSCKPMFPIMMRDVFVDALEYCQVHVMRCVFEADDEVAVLARKLNCPVLSYDSDFYIHNVQYIPSITLTLKVYRRAVAGQWKNAKKVSRKKVLVQEMLDDGTGLRIKQEATAADANETVIDSYYYMDCCIYTIENLVANKGLSDEMLPLFAILIGNDYINRSIFWKFFHNVSLKGTGKKNSQQGKRIVGILRWLQNQTLDSAITKILSRVEKGKREWMQNQMESAMGGYNCEESTSYSFFGFKEQQVKANTMVKSVFDQITENVTNSSNGDIKDAIDNEIDSMDDDSSETMSADLSDVEIISMDEDGKNDNDDDQPNEQHNLNNGADSIDNDSFDNDIIFESFAPPDWMQANWLRAKLPRYIIDLLHLRLYINSPQVENFLFPDAHEIAVPILQLIFSIVHHPNKPELSYLTRVQRISNMHYKKIQCVDKELPFDSTVTDNLETFKLAFHDFPNIDAVIEIIKNQLPADYQLYALAIIYWAKYSKHMNAVHINSLILCLIVLSIIDTTIEPIRAKDKFEHKYRAQLCNSKLKKESSHVSSECHQSEANSQTDTQLPEPPACTIGLTDLISSVNKLECIYAQQNLRTHFDLNSKLRSRHTEFSSTIIHAYAELQAIVFELNSLNTLCGGSLSNVKISNVYNGVFLYNMYVALKERPDISYYLEKFIFGESPTLFKIYECLVDILKPFIVCLKPSVNGASKLKKSRNMRKKKQRNAKKKIENEINSPAVEEECAEVNASESDFEDLNNKFSGLLKM